MLDKLMSSERRTVGFPDLGPGGWHWGSHCYPSIYYLLFQGREAADMGRTAADQGDESAGIMGSGTG